MNLKKLDFRYFRKWNKIKSGNSFREAGWHAGLLPIYWNLKKKSCIYKCLLFFRNKMKCNGFEFFIVNLIVIFICLSRLQYIYIGCLYYVNTFISFNLTSLTNLFINNLLLRAMRINNFALIPLNLRWPRLGTRPVCKTAWNSCLNRGVYVD